MAVSAAVPIGISCRGVVAGGEGTELNGADRGDAVEDRNELLEGQPATSATRVEVPANAVPEMLLEVLGEIVVVGVQPAVFSASAQETGCAPPRCRAYFKSGRVTSRTSQSGSRRS